MNFSAIHPTSVGKMPVHVIRCLYISAARALWMYGTCKFTRHLAVRHHTPVIGIALCSFTHIIMCVHSYRIVACCLAITRLS